MMGGQNVSTSQSTRQQIYDAAVNVIAERGFYSATTDSIAHAAGLSVGTIYNYFKNKEELLSAIFEHELSKRLGWLVQLQQQKLGTKQTLERFFSLHCRDFEHALPVARILLRERSFARDNDPRALRSYMESIPAEIGKVIAQGQQTGEIRPDINASIAARILFHAMEGLVTTAVEADDPALLHAGHKALITMLWEGMAVP